VSRTIPLFTKREFVIAKILSEKEKTTLCGGKERKTPVEQRDFKCDTTLWRVSGDQKILKKEEVRQIAT